jgi:RNA polymerase sigma factor for flagellar operon FliA
MSQVNDLWQEYKIKGDEKAREELILNYAYLAKYVLDRMHLRPSGPLGYEDLLGYAVCGLIDAIERFDISRAIKLETFAMPRIRGAILDAIKSQDWVPRSVRASVSELKRTMAKLEAQLGRSATDAEIASAMDISIDDLNDLLSNIEQSSILSLDELLMYGDESKSGSSLGATESMGLDPLYAAELEESKSLLANALKDLPEREKMVMAFYYKEGLTFKEIARILDVTESRVCQIHSKAIIRLKGKLERHSDLMMAVV